MTQLDGHRYWGNDVAADPVMERWYFHLKKRVAEVVAVLEERSKTHGNPIATFAKTKAYETIRTGFQTTGRDVGMFNVSQKMARDSFDPSWENLCDMIGYLFLIQVDEDVEAEQNSGASKEPVKQESDR